MGVRLSGQTSIFGVVFFVSKSLLGIERQKKLEKFADLTRKPRSHARILIYRTWPIPEARPSFELVKRMRSTSYRELWTNVSLDRWAVNFMQIRYARCFFSNCCLSLIKISCFKGLN